MDRICRILPRATSGAMFSMGMTSIRRIATASFTITRAAAERDRSGRPMGVGSIFIIGEVAALAAGFWRAHVGFLNGWTRFNRSRRWCEWLRLIQSLLVLR